MSYIHISNGKFRRPLPQGIRRRSIMTKNNTSSSSSSSDDSGGGAAFLASNTQSSLMWDNNSNDAKHNNHNATMIPKKETSCEVEIDIHVRDILNVKTVMKSLPKNKDEREQIHWRAVPSLYEIWQQERSRMSQLLPKPQNFLLPKKEIDAKPAPSFTLNVKKNQPIPGTRLALEGMRRLVNVSLNLQTNFYRSLKDIMIRYETEIQSLDNKILLSYQNHRQQQQDDDNSTKMSQQYNKFVSFLPPTNSSTPPQMSSSSMSSSSLTLTTPNHRALTIHRNVANAALTPVTEAYQPLLSSTSTTTATPNIKDSQADQEQTQQPLDEQQQEQQLTPTAEEAIEAFAALGVQFDNDDDGQQPMSEGNEEPKAEEEEEEAIEAFAALGVQFDNDDDDNDDEQQPIREGNEEPKAEEEEDNNNQKAAVKSNDGVITSLSQQSPSSSSQKQTNKYELFQSLSQTYYNTPNRNNNNSTNNSYIENSHDNGENMILTSSSSSQQQQQQQQQVFLSCSPDIAIPHSNNYFSQTQSPSLSQSQSQLLYSAQRQQQQELDPMELSQRIDRGESIIDGPFQHVEDFIDPQTLTPYETLDDEDDDVLPTGDGEYDEDEDEDNLDEQGLERVLTILATQTTNASSTGLASLPTAAVMATPNASTPAGGMLSMTVEEMAIDGDDDSMEDDDEEEAYKEYNIVNNSSPNNSSDQYSTPEGDKSRSSKTGRADELSDGSNIDEPYEDKKNMNGNRKGSNLHDDINNDPSNNNESSPSTESIRKVIQFPPKPWEHPANVYIERKQLPPSRATVQLPNTKLLSCHRRRHSQQAAEAKQQQQQQQHGMEAVPPWLIHAANYASMQKERNEGDVVANNNKKNNNRKKKHCHWFPRTCGCSNDYITNNNNGGAGVWIEPTLQPPNRKMVISWYNKSNNHKINDNDNNKGKPSKKRKKATIAGDQKKKKKENIQDPPIKNKRIVTAKQSICSVSNLQVDDNSRKFVATNARDENDVENHGDTGNNEENEEEEEEDEEEAVEKEVESVAMEKERPMVGEVLTTGTSSSGDHRSRMVEEVEWKSSQSPYQSQSESQLSGMYESPMTIGKDPNRSNIRTVTTSSTKNDGESVVGSTPVSDRMAKEGASSSSTSTPKLSDSQCTAESCAPTIIAGDSNTNTPSSLDGSTRQEQQQQQSSSNSTQDTALEGMGNQGGKLWVAGGGRLKAKTRPPSQVTETPTKNENSSKKREIAEDRNKKGKGARQKGFSYYSYLPSPVSIFSVEVHVQCRSGRAGMNDSKEIAMTPDPDRDMVYAVVYVYAKDPGGGVAMEILERGCLFVPVGKELDSNGGSSGSNVSLALRKLSKYVRSNMPQNTMGILSPLVVEAVKDEKQLLLRVASIVRWKDPDMLLSWDTQGAGLGYLIERGSNIGISFGGSKGSGEEPTGGGDTATKEIDMARLLGRTPTVERKSSPGLAHPSASSTSMDTFKTSMKPADGGESKSTTSGLNPDKSLDDKKTSPGKKWEGSGLGSEWDERVGAGAASSSIIGRLVFAAWKIIAEEVKHPNASYLPAIVSTVLNKRIPHHDNLTLTNWYAYKNGRERWRVLNHRLVQATSCLLLLDALDIIGRAGEAARLSGVEFSQSFPGIRGSQYKVEGVLLRALQSLHSEERGSKRGKQLQGGKQKKNMTGASGSMLTAASADYTPLGVRGTTSSSSCFSDESKSQTQSPWKARRMGAARHQQKSQRGESLEICDGEETDDLSRPVHEFSSRGYFFYSPSLEDSNKQEALEAQALNLEPQSGHYQDPVVVCDFTALYPSLVIAYNLCYSTCAGRLDYHSTREEMYQEGRTTGRLGPFLYSENRTATVLKHHMKSLNTLGGDIPSVGENKSDWKRDRAYVAPTGTIYVSESVVKGVLPQVLDELLSTRAMLKKASKQYKKMVPDLCPSILRQIEARQLALKYVANVTYGYTSATFSGRCAMPLLADTIVECGRRTLNNAMRLATRWGKDRDGRWHGCEVIYGDTDSVFVKLPGRSVKEAFQFGEQFCKAVTATNPPPVQLKLEKVYLGSIMQTKKKYCGMKFESADQKKPVFEAKGIETIRRDQCALTQKILRNTLVTLFRNDLTAVREYLFRQWSLILSGQLPVSDFILTGRVRSRYRGGRIGPVQAALARRLAEADPGKVVRHKERLAYVIVATPGAAFRLRDCVLTPMELLEQWDAYTIHTAYYITKHVNAALQRCLGLAPHHIDVNSWYEKCPKPRRRIHHWPVTRSGSSSMISSYFGSDMCSLCGKKCMAQGRARAVVCIACKQNSALACHTAMGILRNVQQEAHAVARRCGNCNQCYEDATTFAAIRPKGEGYKSKKLYQITSHPPGVIVPLANCSCIDCPVTYERHRLREAQLEAESICHALDI